MVHQDLKPLLIVQELDEVVRGAQAELAGVQPELDAFDAELATAERALEGARTHVEETLSRRRALEEKIENYRQLQERKQERLEYVRGPKEASALMAEIDLTRNVMAQEEAEWLRSSGSVADAEKKVKEAEAVLETVRAEQAPKREEIEGRLVTLREHVAAAERERDVAAEGVKPNLLQVYQRIRGSRGKGLFALHGSACGNCFTNIPVHRRALVEQGAVVEVCEACGVLLFVPEAG